MFNPKVDYIKQCIISILNDDNETIGYGFYISPHGTAFTCYHIIASLTHIRIKEYDGNIYDATIDEYYTRDYADISDMAILTVPKGTPKFLHIGANPKDNPEVTIIHINEGFEFKDILHESNKVLNHPPDFHGLPATVTNTTLAVGFLSATGHWPNVFSIWKSGKSVQQQLLFQYLSDKFCPEKYTDRESQIKTILNSHLQATAKTLIEKKIILPHYHYYEAQSTYDLENFLKSNNYTLFLYGESGTGKTTLLLNTAALHADNYFTFFLPAADLEVFADSLPGKIKSFLTKLLTKHPYYTITVDDIMEVIFQQPQKCLIIIDGLNKMPRRSTTTFNNWFTRSVRWAKGLHLKVIFSSTYSSSSEQHTYPTYGFSTQNIKQVHARYELPEHFKYISRTHHPMLIRFLHDISSKERSAPLDDYPLLATYLARKCSAIGRLADLPTKTIYTILLDIAKHFITTNDYWISTETFHHILKDYPQLPPILLQENIFLESINGIRIINEWIADFLIGETLQPDIDWEQFLTTSTQTERKGIPWLLARRSYQGHDVSQLLQNLLSFIWENNTYQRKAVNIFVHTIRHLSNPDRYYQIIESFFFSEKNNYFKIKLVGPLVYYSHLSFTNQLKLIKLTLSTEPLIPLDIHLYLGVDFNWNYLNTGIAYETKVILSRYIAISPEKTFANIATWINDNDNILTNMIAAILLKRFQKKLTHRYELIPFNKRSQDTPAQLQALKTIFIYLASSERPFMNALQNEWPKQRVFRENVLYDHTLYITWLTQIVLKVLHNMTDLPPKVQAITWLIRVAEYRKEMIGELLHLLKTGKMPERIVGELSPYVLNEEYFDIIVPMMVKYIGYGANYGVRKECIPVLFQFGHNETQNLILAKNLIILLQEGLADFNGLFTDQLVLGLCIMPATSEAYKILLETIPSLLVRDLKIWYPIAQHLCRREKHDDKRRDKIKWIKWGLEFLNVKTRCSIVILLLDMEIIKDEDIVFNMIKPTILESLSKSEQFFDAVLKKCAKKNQIALFHDVMNDVDFRVVRGV
jgi:hypothetical protein